MTQTTFTPHGAAPTEEGLYDIVHDESARVFRIAGETVGHAGLFSTAPDLLKFLEMLLNDGKRGRIQYLHSQILENLRMNQIPHLGDATGLGFELNQPWMGAKRSPHTFGKTGFTGTSVACDIAKGIALVILSNRIYPKRPVDTSTINSFRADVCDIVFRS